MAHPRDSFERREFLKSGLLAAGATAVGVGLTSPGAPSAHAAAPEAPAPAPAATSPEGIPLRAFGRTGHTLPILGMGGSAMTQLFIQAYGVELLPIDERIAMVRHAFDSGIRYFDTARVYGESESIVGRGLKGVREQCYVATKCAVADPAQVRKSVETSLKQLDMDYVDCLQIHSPAIERVGFEKAMKLHAEVVKLRDEKLLRFIGLTTHVAFEDVLKMIETDGFDQVLLAYGYFRKGMDTMLSNTKIEYRERCLAAAHQRQMAIVAMKVMGANIFSHNAEKLVPDFPAATRQALPAAAIRWVLADDRVSLLNIGVSLPADVDANLATLRGDLRLTAEDRAALATFAQRAYESQYVTELKVT
ncbi:MAG: aldo/keto reductase [Pirellulales bacterium]|nr:aldo/keto reductase [Pirellulales bacterium]